MEKSSGEARGPRSRRSLLECHGEMYWRHCVVERGHIEEGANHHVVVQALEKGSFYKPGSPYGLLILHKHVFNFATEYVDDCFNRKAHFLMSPMSPTSLACPCQYWWCVPAWWRPVRGMGISGTERSTTQLRRLRNSQAASVQRVWWRVRGASPAKSDVVARRALPWAQWGPWRYRCGSTASRGFCLLSLRPR